MKRQYKFKGLITIEEGAEKYVLPSIEQGCQLQEGEAIDFFDIKRVENPIRYLFVHLEVQDGERKHDHKVVFATRANNLGLSAQRYVANYWGYGKREEDWWWWDGEIAGRLVSWKELTEQSYNLLNEHL